MLYLYLRSVTPRSRDFLPQRQVWLHQEGSAGGRTSPTGDTWGGPEHLTHLTAPLPHQPERDRDAGPQDGQGVPEASRPHGVWGRSCSQEHPPEAARTLWPEQGGLCQKPHPWWPLQPSLREPSRHVVPAAQRGLQQPSERPRVSHCANTSPKSLRKHPRRPAAAHNPQAQNQRRGATRRKGHPGQTGSRRILRS